MGQRESSGGDANTRSATSFAIALATALKNCAIYPHTHNRVAESIGAFLAHFEPLAGDSVHTLLVRGTQVFVDGQFTDEHTPGTAWLTERLRDAALRGIAFTPDCSIEDVIAFAKVLHRCRPGRATSFEVLSTEARRGMAPLPLQFEGHHRVGETVDGKPQPPRTPEPASSAVPFTLQSMLAQLGENPTLQERLRAIEACTADDQGQQTREIDLMAAIAQVLPADVSSHPEQIEAAVEQILATTLAELTELVRRDGKVQGANLLRRALSIARHYFGGEAPTSASNKKLPSGRPEDAPITGDLDALLAEVATLPTIGDSRLPLLDDLVRREDHLLEQLGLQLHYLSQPGRGQRADSDAQLIARLAADCPAGTDELLAAYFRPLTDLFSTPPPEHMVKALVKVGFADRIAQIAGIDAAFVARGFPERLPLAVDVLGHHAEGLWVLQTGLEAIKPLLANGGARAAAQKGVLQPELVRVLARLGGEAAAILLEVAADSDVVALRQIVLETAGTRRLPAPEATVWCLFPDATRLPRDFPRRLWGAACRGIFDPALRATTGELLRRALRDQNLASDLQLQAIDALGQVPGDESRATLDHLRLAGRWSRFGKQARNIRRHARKALANLPPERTA